jgi:broad specificity phosphatase PhoE
MKEEDIIHLSDVGREQMRAMGELLKKKGFVIDGVESSPETRAQESAAGLNEVLHAGEVEMSSAVDDVYGPGPYLERMTMDEFAAMGGDAYDTNWQKYGHESRESIVDRMNTKFWEIVDRTKPGHARVMVSHGDPIAWLANTLAGQPIPLSGELRRLRYPAKGDALLAVIHPDGSLFTDYLISNPKTKQTIY